MASTPPFLCLHVNEASVVTCEVRDLICTLMSVWLSGFCGWDLSRKKLRTASYLEHCKSKTYRTIHPMYEVLTFLHLRIRVRVWLADFCVLALMLHEVDQHSSHNISSVPDCV
jgi:hypothetical protein